jgi:hypothetical protein
MSPESRRARQVGVYLTGLLAGTSPETSHLVLTGFSENSLEEKYDREGDLCLWDVRTQSQFRLGPYWILHGIQPLRLLRQHLRQATGWTSRIDGPSL